jgi:hypothetical protein
VNPNILLAVAVSQVATDALSTALLRWDDAPHNSSGRILPIVNIMSLCIQQQCYMSHMGFIGLVGYAHVPHMTLNP